MDHSQELKSVRTKPGRRRTTRKWREIESLKEKYRLRDELREMDYELDLDVEIDELDF